MKIELNKERIKKSIIFIFIITLLLGLFLYLNKQFSFFIPCIFHKLTGLYCPGCGITRMIISIINLNFKKAFEYNQLAFILSPFIMIYAVIYYYNWIQNKQYKINEKIWYALIIISIIFMILRNIPQFDFLAPK